MFRINIHTISIIIIKKSFKLLNRSCQYSLSDSQVLRLRWNFHFEVYVIRHEGMAMLNLTWEWFPRDLRLGEVFQSAQFFLYIA